MISMAIFGRAQIEAAEFLIIMIFISSAWLDAISPFCVDLPIAFPP